MSVKSFPGIFLLKIFFLLTTLWLIFSCERRDSHPEAGQVGEGVEILCTTFPVYDWVRNIVGNDDEITVTLLSNGVDMHNFSATAETFVTIAGSELLICIGGISENWLDNLPKSMKPRRILKLIPDTAHDEHIWLSLRDAVYLCNGIRDELIEMYPRKEKQFIKNCAAYTAKIMELLDEVAVIAQKHRSKKVLFADRFPFGPFFHDEIFRSNQIECFAPFSSCGTENSAGFDKLVFLAKKIDEFGIKTIFIPENSDKKIAEAVKNLSEVKPEKTLMMDSMQTISSEEISEGKTYLGTMAKNIAVLEEGLR